MTNRYYNTRLVWRTNAPELDRVVTACSWEGYTPEMPDEEILRRLLALNLARSGQDAA